MKFLFPLAATLAVALALPASAQTPLEAPPGWTTQTRANHATTFSPPDLSAGEVYSITIYDAASLHGQTLAAWLKGFGGTVGTAVGSLAAPLKIQVTEGQIVSGRGLYIGPRGTALNASFIGATLDGGKNIHLMRLLFCGPESLLDRYGEGQNQLVKELIGRAKADAGVLKAEAGVQSEADEKERKAAAKAAARAEEKRFKWVTKPGRGVPNAQIAAVLFHSNFNLQFPIETVTLLLKDGTAYEDLPVPPDELDIVASRAREPKKWGRWRKTAKGYDVSWAGAPYEELPGSVTLPATAPTRLNGYYSAARSSGFVGVGMTSWYSMWGVTFQPGGRFQKTSSGGASVSNGLGSDSTSVSTTYNDQGAVTSASGSNFAALAERKKRNPNGAREGDYSLSGYVLTLRYDDGTVTRLPFFFLGPTHETIWFEGAMMGQKDK